MRRAWSADRKALNRVGLEAFQHHIAESCAKMPVFVTEPSFFKAGECRRRVRGLKRLG